MSLRAGVKTRSQGPSASKRALVTRLALQMGPPLIALSVLGIWLLQLSMAAAIGAAVLAIGICVTYGAALRAVLTRDREIEMIRNAHRLEAQIDSHKLELERTNHRLGVRLRELSLLFEITRAISSTLELGELIKLLTETIGVALDFQEFAMLLLDEGTGELRVAATYGVPEPTDIDAMRLEIGNGAVGRAAKGAQIVLIDEPAESPGGLLKAGPRRVGSLLAIPLKCQDRVVGVMSFRRPTANAFAPDEIKLLAAIANQAAMAIVNARLYQKTVELSLTDPLTNVANRRHLFQKLEIEIARAQRFGTDLSVLMIDIDHFKLYNDRHGHPAGDDALKAVGEALVRNVRKIDTVARYGGEEFVVILPQIRSHEAILVGEKLRRAVSRLGFAAKERPDGYLTVSIGLAHVARDVRGVRDLIAQADAALYAAKTGGRDRLVAYSHRPSDQLKSKLPPQRKV